MEKLLDFAFKKTGSGICQNPLYVVLIQSSHYSYNGGIISYLTNGEKGAQIKFQRVGIQN